jgi:valyl-tRNA synthetase
MPFITEEIWQLLLDRKEGESLMVSQMPQPGKSRKSLIKRFEIVKEIVSSVRTIRKEKDLPTKERLELFIKASPEEFDEHFLPVIIKIANLSGIYFTEVKQDDAASFLVSTTEFYIPLGSRLDTESELKKINEELNYNRGFLLSVMKKLDNERFVQNAPDSVIENENKKKADAESKIRSLEERKKELGKL